MTDRARYSWCALMQYRGREPFILGTVWTDTAAAVEQARAALLDLHRAMMPLGTPDPASVEVVPGAIVFRPREAADA